MIASDPIVARALRMGKNRRQQAQLLQVSERTVQKVVYESVPPFRGQLEAESPTIAVDREGQPIKAGDFIVYPEQKGGRDLKRALVIEVLPPFVEKYVDIHSGGLWDPHWRTRVRNDRPFRLRVRKLGDNRLSTVSAVERVKVVESA